MNESRPRADRRVSTPLVLAASSLMLSLGALVLFAKRPTPPSSPDRPADLRIDQRTPEHAAESFLDAWRKRRFDDALRLSKGMAAEAVRAKKARDQALGAEAEDMLKVWEQLAENRLELRVRESENLREARLALRGDAVGEFMGRPYQRPIEFVLMRVDDKWFVEEMYLGDAPDLSGDAGARREAGDFEMREPPPR